jgi:hypothetical protein
VPQAFVTARVECVPLAGPLDPLQRARSSTLSAEKFVENCLAPSSHLQHFSFCGRRQIGKGRLEQ